MQNPEKSFKLFNYNSLIAVARSLRQTVCSSNLGFKQTAAVDYVYKKVVADKSLCSPAKQGQDVEISFKKET